MRTERNKDGSSHPHLPWSSVEALKGDRVAGKESAEPEVAPEQPKIKRMRTGWPVQALDTWALVGRVLCSHLEHNFQGLGINWAPVVVSLPGIHGPGFIPQNCDNQTDYLPVSLCRLLLTGNMTETRFLGQFRQRLLIEEWTDKYAGTPDPFVLLVLLSRTYLPQGLSCLLCPFCLEPVMYWEARKSALYMVFQELTYFLPN